MGNRMNDCIKLAEAMNIDVWYGEVTCKPFGLPDPFTDANDDYAVLEWMRGQGWIKEHIGGGDNAMLIDHRLIGSTMFGQQWGYQIGDYARAALKVLDTQEGET